DFSVADDPNPDHSRGGTSGGAQLAIEDLVARDSNGDLLTNWNYLTQSGFRYNAIAAPASVPEPSSFLLAALPIAVGVLSRKKLRHSRGARRQA
ncbi:MAG: hypothetical protein H7039_10745, partial [Bryobacteraceae bacterium]|nr:hypothetical protein [Bryobacteraceae bacterium]